VSSNGTLFPAILDRDRKTSDTHKKIAKQKTRPKMHFRLEPVWADNKDPKHLFPGS